MTLAARVTRQKRPGEGTGNPACTVRCRVRIVLIVSVASVAVAAPIMPHRGIKATLRARFSTAETKVT